MSKIFAHITIGFIAFLFSLISFWAIPVFSAGEESAPISIKSEEMMNVYVDGSLGTKVPYEGLVFLGGSFSQVQIEGYDPEARSNFAIIDTHNRKIVSATPSFDGRVEAIEIVGDTLIIGGSFHTVSGVSRPHIVLLDKSSYAQISTQIEVNAPVFALARYDQTLFAGGHFTAIQGQERSYVASIDTKTWTLNRFNPSPNNAVYSLLANNSVLYVGGAFTKIAGEMRNYTASFRLPSGELTDWTLSTGVPVYRLIQEGGEIKAVLFTDIAIDINPIGSITLPPTPVPVITTPPSITPSSGGVSESDLMINTKELGFQIPSLGDVLTFAIRIFFVIAGLAALFYMLLGAFAWISSGGDKDSVTAAREKIQAAVIGLIMIVAVLAIVWTLEQVIFNRRICLGVSCPLTIPSLLVPTK